jgi:hypothetical protein
MRPKSPDGYDYCNDCKETKLMEDFPKSVGSYCKACLNIRTKNSPNYKENARKGHLKARYGITIEQYDAMLKKQQGVCAICTNPETVNNKKWLAVDHDHNTGFIRGLLCHDCNTGIAKLKDSQALLKSAIWYLDKSKVELENQVKTIMNNNLEKRD